MKTLSLSFLFCLTLTFSAQAQRYVCGLSCTVTNRGTGLGAITTTFYRRDLLNTVAVTGGRSLNPADLQLVFDVAAQQFQVVQKADGALVVVVYMVTGAKDFGVGATGLVNLRLDSLRQASLLEPGASGVVGSIGGEITEIVDPSDGDKVYLHWKARFSVLSKTGGAFVQALFSSPSGYPAQYVATPSLVQGQFSVHGLPFVPTGN